MQNPNHFSLPDGIHQCDLCGCFQPLSQLTAMHDGYICDVHVEQAEAQLEAEAQQRAILEEQSKH